MLLRDIDVLIIKLTGYRFFYVVADFGACLFVEELFAAADDDDDTENHQQEGMISWRPSTRKTAVPAP